MNKGTPMSNKQRYVLVCKSYIQVDIVGEHISELERPINLYIFVTSLMDDFSLKVQSVTLRSMKIKLCNYYTVQKYIQKYNLLSKVMKKYLTIKLFLNKSCLLTTLMFFRYLRRVGYSRL